MPNKLLPACLAPKLDSDGLEVYRSRANSAGDGPVRDSMLELIAMIEKYWEVPVSDSTSETKPLPCPLDVCGKQVTELTMKRLSQDQVQRIWDKVPWENELNAMGDVFQGISAETDKTLRDSAFHLLWYGRELFLDREPITMDQA